MANIANVFTEKSSKNQSNFEVITLSSDEEQSEQSNEDVSFLFKRFILACRPHVTKDAIKNVRSVFTEVQGKLTASHNVVDMLGRYGKEIKKENADLYLSLICSALNEEKSRKYKSVEMKSVGDNLGTHKVAKSVTFCDVIAARGFEPNTKLPTNQNNNPTTSTAEIATISDDDDFVSKKSSKKQPDRIENMPSTSNRNAKADNTKGKISTKTLTAKQRKKLVARLKQRLKEISNEIKILNRAELTLEEMDMCDSTYIQENRLKKKFEKTWTKLCKILGRLPNTGRVVEKSIRASSTGYSMIDKAVAKFLKEKHGSYFPDYFDIRDIVLKTNQKHDLRMSCQVLNGLIADIFTDIGNKLQRQRERDLLFNFGSHLLDDFKVENDPALSNEDLANQLEKNRRISKRNLKQVYAKYTHLERYKIDDKTRKSGPSRVNKDTNSDSGTSDDEQDGGSSRNHKKYARLDPREVMGKSIMKGSRGFDSDISSESSDNEQDLSRIEDNSVVVDDSDVTSSQEFSFVSTTSKPDMSLSHLEQSLSDTDQVTVSLSDNKRPGSPTFPLTCPALKWHESGTSEQTVSTFDPEHSNNDTRTDQQTFSSSSDCEIINNPNEQKLDTPANEPLVPDRQTNTDYDCEIVNEPAEQLVTMKQLDEPVNKSPVPDKHPNTDDDCEIVNDPKQRSVTMKQLDEPAEKSVNEPPPNTDDCEIVNDPKQQLVTMKQLDEPAEKSVNERPPNTDDCEIVNDPKQRSVTMKQLDEPAEESVNEPPPNTGDDCEIVNPKQRSVTMKQLDEPAEEPVNEPPPNTDGDCLIIDDDQDDPPTHSEPLKIPTSAPSDELTKTINVLLEVFRKRSEPVDQSKVPVSSCDEPVDQSKVPVSSCDEPVSRTVPDSGCKSTTESLNLKSTKLNSSISQTGTSKAWTSTSDNMEHQSAYGNSDPKPECMTLHSDNDVIMSVDDQCSDSLKDSIGILSDCPPSPKVETNHNIPSTTNSSPSRHRDTLSPETPSNVDNLNKTIASNSSPSPSRSGTRETGSMVNPRKRKATTELSVQIPKSSMQYLEQIAWSLKNKRLKLPDAWVNSRKAVKNSDVSLPKPTTSKESSTVSSALFKPTTSKESSTVSSALFKPTTSKESSTVTSALFKPTTSKEFSTVSSALFKPTTSKESSTVSSALFKPTTSKESSTVSSALFKPTTSKESSTVSSALFKPTTSKESSTVSSALFKPTTSKESSTVSSALFKPTTSKESLTISSALFKPTTSKESSTVSSALFKPTTSKESSTVSSALFKPTTSKESSFRPTTSKESSTVSSALFKPTTSKESSFRPTTSKESSTVTSALFKPTMSKGSLTISSALFKPATSKGSSIVGQTSSENNSHLLNGKAKIDLQQRQVFREKTLNALKVPTKPVCNNNVNGAFQSVDSTPSSKTATNTSLSASDSVDNADKSEVIIIDD